MSYTLSLYLLALTLHVNQAGLARMTTQMTGDVRQKVVMGEANVNCDDGENNLSVDWLDSPLNYTCYHPTRPLLPSSRDPVTECDTLPQVPSPPPTQPH